MVCFFSFALFVIALLSLWVRKDPKIWGIPLILSLSLGWISGFIEPIGFLFIFLLIALWISYICQKRPLSKFFLFVAIVTFSLVLSFEMIPHFPPLYITSHFRIGFTTPLIGFFPLAFLVPLARSFQDWKRVVKGVLFGCSMIVLLAIVAIGFKVVSWQIAFPSFMFTRYSANLFLTAIPEEGFFRGFIQNSISSCLQKYRWGKVASLFATSIIFTLSHIYWSPNLAILIFVFFASLLYGGVYLYSGKIESSMLVHFFLNATHMTLFSYHAA